MQIPKSLVEHWRDDRQWIAELPLIATECARRWELDVEAVVDTPRSLVVLAGDVVLKLNAPSHSEADHEPDALAFWGGTGAVRLLDRDDGRRAFLIERCRPGTHLRGSGVDHLATMAELIARLSRQPEKPEPFRSLYDEAAKWADEVSEEYERRGRPFERSLRDFAIEVFTSADPQAGFLVNQDLHGGNVLSAEREPWLVIDPKPIVGEREVDGVGLLRNEAFSRSRGGSVQRCLDILADVGLDRERCRAWGVAHALAWGWSEKGWSGRSVAAAREIMVA